MDNIIEFIYKSCDQTQTNCVQVSSLISVIKPYMPNNLEELVGLQSKLDPHNIDPYIDCTFFQKVMSDWIANIQEDEINNSLSEFPVNFSQTFSPNMSQVSCNHNSNNNNKINDSNVTSQEQITDLKLKLNKAMSELDLVKQQLAACEDQNESLLADLKCQKLQNKKRHEQVSERIFQSEEIEEEVDLASRKCEHLERMLSNSDKQQQAYLAEICKLESENLRLKNKLQSFEKFKQEDKKSLSDMRDSLDEKESELTTLMEVIDDLKSQLEEKVDLLNFYNNEHKLLKQKIHDLEAVIKNNICHSNTAISQDTSLGGNSQHIFNTPKLLNQLANPISPFIRDFRTSSPLKDLRRIANNLNSSDSLCNISDTVRVSRISPKTLKDELAEVSCIKLNESDDELGRLHKLVKDQENIKNHLWENMKQLSSHNEELLDYKKECLDLMLRIQEKDQVLRDMRKEMKEKDQALIDSKKEIELIKQKVREYANVSDHSTDEELIRHLSMELTNLEDVLNHSTDEKLIRHFSMELTNLEDNLIKKKSISTSLKTSLEYRGNVLEQETFKDLSKQEKTTQTDDTKITKNTSNQSVQVDDGPHSWNLKPALEQPEPRKCNYAKQQMKIERLVEKQEKTAKDLASERSINTKLLQKFQEKCTENEKIKKELESHRKELLNQTQRFETLFAEKNVLENELDILKLEKANLISEIKHIREEIVILKSENQDLNVNLCNMVNKLAVESDTNSKLRVENELLLNNQCHLETQLRGDLIHQFHLKKHLIDSDNVHKLSLKQLEDELSEKGIEIRTLKKQNEVASVEVFISSCNKELRRELVSVCDFFKLEYDFPTTEMGLEYSEDTLDLESQMINLKKQILFAISCMQYIRHKHLNLLNDLISTRNDISRSEVQDHDSDEYINEDVVMNEDSFISCSSDISDFAQDEVASMSFECDSCFEDLRLEPIDLRNLSQREREEKFATLALLLTVDVTTLKKRICSEQEKFRQMTTTFFSHLSYTLHVLSKSRKNANEVVITHLTHMKNLSKDIFKTAVRCGILHSEQRTANCWRLAINYVALLTQENKKLNEKNNSPKLEVKHFPAISHIDEQNNLVTPSASHSSKNSTVKFWICVLFLTFVFLLSLLFYVDHHCRKNTKRVCPLQWISKFFVEKIPSDNFRL